MVQKIPYLQIKWLWYVYKLVSLQKIFLFSRFKGAIMF